VSDFALSAVVNGRSSDNQTMPAERRFSDDGTREIVRHTHPFQSDAQNEPSRMQYEFFVETNKLLSR
jgi:hypothetical protein